MSLQRCIAWSWLAQAQAPRNSLAPFLYQTPTLAFTRSRSPRSPSPSCSRYSTFDTPNSPSAEPQTQAENVNSIGSHENTPSKINSPTESAPAPRRSFLRRKAASVVQPIRILEPWTQKASKKKERKVDRKTARKPNLTTHETRTLAGLFSQLEPEAREGLVQESEKPEPDHTEEDEKMEISAIFDAVLRDAQGRKRSLAKHKDEDKPLDAKSEKEASTNAVKGQGYTPTVSMKRHGKIVVLPDTDEELAELLNTNRMTLANAIELVIKRETAQIDSVLHAAVEKKQDIGFWRLCHKEVFSMVRLLRSNKKTFVPDDSELSSDEGSPEDVQQTPSHTAKIASLNVPACIPIEAIVVGVYPRVLRTAFVLLNLHYPESPLIGQFRTKIISLGRESATLGLSTSLYNDMFYFHWRVTHDFPQVVALGREMEITGASPDYGTINVLEGIVRERDRDLRRRRMGIVSFQPWWDLPPNRKAMRELLGEEGEEEGLISRLKRQYQDMRVKKEIGTPYI